MKRLVVLVLALTGLLLALPSVAPATAAPADDRADSADSTAWASVTAPDQVLHRGCRDYRFSYRVDVPGDEWMIELFLVGPKGSKLGTQTYESSAQRPAEQRTWRVCRTNTLPGVHTIKIKATSYDGRDVSSRWVAPTRFRLSAR